MLVGRVTQAPQFWWTYETWMPGRIKPHGVRWSDWAMIRSAVDDFWVLELHELVLSPVMSTVQMSSVIGPDIRIRLLEHLVVRETQL